MKISHARVPVLCALALGLVAPVQAQGQLRREAPEPASIQAVRTDSAQPLPELREPLIERLRELQDRDPAGFRDLLRRSLSARLLWQAQGEKGPVDLPVELAGGMTTDNR